MNNRALTTNQKTSHYLYFGTALLCILSLTWLLYLPGLSGPFIFDDFPNLRPLEKATTNPDTLDGLLEYATRGIAGPTGRPISLASLFIDGLSGTKNPEHFKRTNILIHLLNGVLLILFFINLLENYTSKNQAYWIAMAAGALWLLHPLSVSTVLYVVQRMTLLMTTFTLLGLIGYLYGRKLIAEHPLQGYVTMSASLMAFGSLAILSKENGALILLYCLAIELTLTPRSDVKNIAPSQHWKTVFLYAPIAAVLLVFVLYWDKFGHSYVIRDFTITERLLTQASVIFEYLRSIFLPSLQDGSVFHDDHPITRTPDLSTIAALTTIATLIGTAFFWRKKHPIYSLGVLWFFFGHSLESTALPLEIYFEHRNYLPMALPILAVVYYVANLHSIIGRRFLLATAYLLTICLLSLMLFQQTKLWGNTPLFAEMIARNHPNSVRANQFLAAHYSDSGNYEAAEEVLRNAYERTKEPILAAQLAQTLCLQDKDPSSILTQIKDVVATTRYDTAFIHTLDKLAMAASSSKPCTNLNIDTLIEIAKSLTKNPYYQTSSTLSALYYSIGNMFAKKGTLNEAIMALDKAFYYDNNPNIPMLQAAWLLSAGLHQEAIRYAEIAMHALEEKIWVSERERENIRRMLGTIEKFQQSNARNTTHNNMRPSYTSCSIYLTVA